MKKSLIIKTFSLLFFSMLFISCSDADDKKAMTKDEVEAEHVKLASEAREKEMAEYQEINKAKIEANEKSLAEFNLRIKNEKLEAKAEYE